MPEQEPTLTEEETANLQARGAATIETDHVERLGQLVPPPEGAMNNPVDR